MGSKKILFYLLFLLLFSFEDVKAQVMLKGGVQAYVQKGRVLQVTLSAPINFYFSLEGDEISGYINEDIKVGEDIFIPKGSQVLGVISKINEPKRFGKDGSFEIEFNELVVLGNRIPIQASVSTDVIPKLEKAADILTYDSALIAFGTFNGAIAGIQYGGIPLAISSHGISVLAGAGVGAGAGILGSALRKGKIPINTIGQSLPFVLKSNLYILSNSLPSFSPSPPPHLSPSSEFKGFRFSPPLKKDQVQLEISSIKKIHDKKYGDSLLLEVNLKNKSNKSISLSDLKLINSKKKLINPDVLLSGLEALKRVKPNEEIEAKLQYLVSYKKEEYDLVLIDPLDSEEIIRVSLRGEGTGEKGIRDKR